MSNSSKSELARLLGDEELGEQAYRLNILSRWPSLRVLDFLFTEGRSTTGDIARGVNMDMREIRDTVDLLSEIGILREVNEGGTSYWLPASEEYLISVENQDGLELKLETELSDSAVSKNNEKTGSQSGIFARIGARIDRFIDPLR
jgi:hypothetical protein